MADFSISQFKEYVQTFINAAKIDDGNGIIETKNGELSKVLSNFNLEESQIGDLLIKSDNSANRTKNSNSAEQPSSEDIHKAFIEAYKIYDNMTTEQKSNVRELTVQNANANYEKMMEIVYPMVEALYDSLTDLPDDNIIDGTEFKAHIANIVSTFTQRIQKQMEEKIESYDRAFSEYDITYHSAFKEKENEFVSQISNANNIPERFGNQVRDEMLKYLSEDTTSLTLKENKSLATKFLEAINRLVQNNINELEAKRDEIAENYKNDLEASIIELDSDNPQVVPWNPPLDGQPHEEEPEYIAIQGAPVKKTFTDVVNEVAKNISSVETISSTETDNNKTPIYDMNGHIVTGDLEKGKIYIQNGKKFIAQ